MPRRQGARRPAVARRTAGKLIGLIQAPATKIARMLQEPGAQLARVFAAPSGKESGVSRDATARYSLSRNLQRTRSWLILQKIVDDLSSLTVLEAAELAKLLEEKWGVSAAAPVAGGRRPAAAAGRRRSRSRPSSPSS